ncbi:response regulator transcription factor [Bacillus sp. JCM 19034]|uniref:response regulator transcription factor n=1 Tax=Bacillus sp. JCM 19034 TaxID=1481928 RepID=UPI00078439FD|nr:response regulator [Bacillus sp. JCM 19034]
MKETIVLLDRNDIIINILKKHFPNYKFYHDRTLDKALSHATVKDISLIIIMQDSYDETGGFLCQQFRMHDINVPIVLLTSSQDDYDAVITYELGADDYIVLPINERVLVARLKANIRRAHCCKVKKV